LSVSKEWLKRAEKVPVFCDDCGDIVVAWKPINVRFPDGSEIVINLCLECWAKFERMSRRLKVAKLLKILR